MPSLDFKENVTICFSLSNLAILEQAREVLFEYSYDCVVTGGLEGTHSLASAHYRNAALDFRVHHIPHEARRKVYEALCVKFGCDPRSGLGPKYFILWEAQGKPHEHFHINEKYAK